MDAKDWVTGILALLALVVSAATAYYTALRQADDLRVVSSLEPVVIIDDKGKLGISGRQEITFINSGNRDIAVTGATLVIFKLAGPPSANSQCNEGTQVASLVYEVEPSILLKAGEIVVKKFDATLFPQLWVTDSHDSNLKYFVLGHSLFGKGEVAFTCLRLTVTTPEMMNDHALVPKHYIAITDIPHTGPSASSVSFISDSNKPYPVVQTTHTVFTH
jgi:hypothetical protein